MSSLVRFLVTVPSDDEAVEHISLHLFETPDQEISNQNIVDTPDEYWDAPLSDQVSKDCAQLYDTYRHRRCHLISDFVFRQHVWNTQSLIGSLRHASKVKGHSGCVNTVQWNDSGSLLVSSGDDCRLIVSDYNNLEKQIIIPTGHTANVFCAKFVPAKPEWVVTCSGDNQVRLFDINSCRLLMTYEGHTDRVKKFVIPPSTAPSSLCVYSCSEDGTIKLIDLRAKVKAAATPASEQLAVPPLQSNRYRNRLSRPSIFRQLATQFDEVSSPPRRRFLNSTEWSWEPCYSGTDRETVAVFKPVASHFTSSDRRPESITSIAIASLRSDYIVLGGDLPSMWLLDRRLLGRPASGSRLSLQTEPVAEFKPKGRPNCNRITGVSISYDGHRVVGSWGGERIYQFSVDHTVARQTRDRRSVTRHRTSRNRFLGASEMLNIIPSAQHIPLTRPCTKLLRDNTSSQNMLSSISDGSVNALSRTKQNEDEVSIFTSKKVHSRKRRRTDPSRSFAEVSPNENHLSDVGCLPTSANYICSNGEELRRIALFSSRYRSTYRRRCILISSRSLDPSFHMVSRDRDNINNVPGLAAQSDASPFMRQTRQAAASQLNAQSSSASEESYQGHSAGFSGSQSPDEQIISEKRELVEHGRKLLEGSRFSQMSSLPMTLEPSRGRRIQPSSPRGFPSEENSVLCKTGHRRRPGFHPAPHANISPLQSPQFSQISTQSRKAEAEEVDLHCLPGEGPVNSDDDVQGHFELEQQYESLESSTIFEKGRSLNNCDSSFTSGHEVDLDVSCHSQFTGDGDGDEDDLSDSNRPRIRTLFSKKRWSCAATGVRVPLAPFQGLRCTESNSSSSRSSDDETPQRKSSPTRRRPREIETSYINSFKGHCNLRTVKEVEYLGPASQYIGTGSDDGRFFIFDAETANLVFVGHNADSEAVNCVVGHPVDPIVVTSGIDSDAKIWVPGPFDSSLDPKSDKIKKIVRQNERRSMSFFQLLEALRNQRLRNEENENLRSNENEDDRSLNDSEG